MGPVIGRADDMLIIRGVNLFPSQVEALLQDFHECSPHFQLLIRKQENMEAVELRIELNENLQLSLSKESGKDSSQEWISSLNHRIAKRIKDIIGLSIQINICEQGIVPRSEGGKLGRVVDERNR